MRDKHRERTGKSRLALREALCSLVRRLQPALLAESIKACGAQIADSNAKGRADCVHTKPTEQPSKRKRDKERERERE